MKAFDSSGKLKYVLCSLVLFVNHGLRDFLITGISSISSFHNETAGGGEEKLHNGFGSFNMRSVFKSEDETCCLDEEEGWTSASVGGILSIFYAGNLIIFIASPFIIPRFPTKYILAVSLIASGILGLFTELVANGSVIGLLLLRLCQGLLQGWCFPFTVVILGVENESSFAVPYFLTFLAPWIGSSMGTLMGCAKSPFIGGYIFGSMSVLTGILIFFLKLDISKSKEKPSKSFQECITSTAVLSCLFLQLTTVWALHLLSVGLSLTVDFKLGRSDLLWYVPIAVLIGGIITRIVAITAMHLLRTHFLSPLNRRRLIIVAGSVMVTAALLTNGTAGINSETVLFIMTIIGICGVGILLVGIRLNLHDLGPIYPTPFLVLGSISSSIGASLSSLLFPIMAQIEEIKPLNTIEEGPWRTAWMAPVSLVFVSCCVHSFLIAAIPLPHQTTLSAGNNIPELKINGNTPPKEEVDAKSFKSIKSAVSFKSAVSKHRTRTISFKTVDENIEADMQSVPESKSDDCVSISEDNNSEEMKSVKSEVSFKSAARTSFDARQYGVILNAQGLDRTSAWLSTHHDAETITKQTSVEKEIVERNMLIALPW